MNNTQYTEKDFNGFAKMYHSLINNSGSDVYIYMPDEVANDIRFHKALIDCIADSKKYVSRYDYLEGIEIAKIVSDKNSVIELLEYAEEKKINYDIMRKYYIKSYLDDLDVAKVVTRNDSQAINEFSYNIKNNDDIVLPILEKHPEVVHYVNERFNNNNIEYLNGRNKFLYEFKNAKMSAKDKVFPHQKTQKEVFDLYSEKYINDKEACKEILNIRQDYFRYMPKEFKSDKELINIAIGDSDNYKYIDSKLRAKDDFNRELLGVNPYLISNDALKKFRGDVDVMSGVVNKLFSLIKYVDDSIVKNNIFKQTLLEQDESMVYLQVSNEWFPEHLKADKDVMIKVVKGNGSYIRYASDELKSDMDLLKAAFPDAKGNTERELVCNAVEIKGERLHYVNNKYWDDKEIVMEAINQGYGSRYNVEYASDRLKNDKDVALVALTVAGDVLEKLGDKVKDDPEVVLKAVRHNQNNIRHASSRLRELCGNNSVEVLQVLATKENLENKINIGVNLKSLEELREEKCMTRKNKI